MKFHRGECIAVIISIIFITAVVLIDKKITNECHDKHGKLIRSEGKTICVTNLKTV